ncbi:MAG: hypothetical protein WC099_01450 [Candidatus Paceibacterota bacterium]
MKKQVYLKKNNGQALLTAVAVVGSIMLSIITIAGFLSVKRIQISRSIVGSSVAIIQADAGIETALNMIVNEEYFLKEPFPIRWEGGGVVIDKMPFLASCGGSGYKIVSRATEQGSTRAIELNLCE